MAREVLVGVGRARQAGLRGVDVIGTRWAGLGAAVAGIARRAGALARSTRQANTTQFTGACTAWHTLSICCCSGIGLRVVAVATGWGNVTAAPVGVLGRGSGLILIGGTLPQRRTLEIRHGCAINGNVLDSKVAHCVRRTLPIAVLCAGRNLILLIGAKGTVCTLAIR